MSGYSQIGLDLMGQVTSLENMMLAWRKLERAFNYGDVWYDELLIVEFKTNLVENLQVLSDQMKNGYYKMCPIRPIPFPKGGKDADGNLKVRQSFFIDFRDQLVWMAVCNIVGHVFDRKMPAWSFGNRLYVSMWKENVDGQKIWRVGNYRNTSRNFYRKWTQSWPLMRRRITASLKMMAGVKMEDLDDRERQTHDDNTVLSENQKHLQLPYLNKDYFEKREKQLSRLYWAGIDLTKFYQLVKMAFVRDVMLKEIGKAYQEDDSIDELIKKLCAFEVDYSDYDYEGGEDDLKAMQLEKGQDFEGLPTGLIVAGFLANIFMLEIDGEVSKVLAQNHDVIHFRYVDDHVIIATEPKILFEWMAWYQKLLDSYGLKVNTEKLMPEEIHENLPLSERDQDEIFIEDCKEIILPVIGDAAAIDPFFPTPLMTQTLQKVSQLQGLNLNMLSAKEYAMVFSELQSLLVADLSEQEIKESTRISFACTMLSRLIVDGEVDYETVKRLRLEWINWLETECKKMREGIKTNKPLYGIDTVEKLDVLVKHCTYVVFDGVEHIDVETLKKEYPFTEKYLYVLENLRNTLTAGQKLTESKERQIFNMLMHALDKVPDKVRVWIRAMGYCVKHQPFQIVKLYEKLDHYENNRLHPLSVEYLRGLLDLLRADHIIRATHRLQANDYQYNRQRSQDILFLKEAFKVNSKKGKLFISNDAQLMMSKAAAFYNLFATRLNLQLAPEEEDFFNSVSGYHHCESLDSTFWLYWVVAKLKYWKRDEQPVITETMKEYVHRVTANSPYYEALFMAYLREVCLTGASGLVLPQDIKGEATWDDEDLKYVILHLPKGIKLPQAMLTDRDRKVLEPVSRSRLKLSVTKWIEEVNAMKTVDSTYSLVHSEVLAVMMMLAIIKAIGKEEEGVQDVMPHPDNFRFYRNDVKQTDWNTILGKVNRGQTLRAEYFPNKALKGKSYTYPTMLDISLPKTLTLCYGLGLIFLQILSKRTILPWTLNTQEAGYDWQRILHDLQGKGQISSLNYRIILACLSPRQRENWRLDKIMADNYVEETFMDNPRIQTILDLEAELKKSLASLKENLISVANEEHRQLIVIDLL